MPTTAPADTAHPTVLVACLCAAWCRVCDGYHETFAALREQNPDYRFVWVDIEDDAELVGDLEVETFPTLLVGDGQHLRFIGPVMPQLASAQRLLAALDPAAAPSASPAAQALLARLQSSC
jgi:thiol-disulfide isomerase/thioredoxin